MTGSDSNFGDYDTMKYSRTMAVILTGVMAVIMLSPATVLAQKTVKAEDILRDINAGKTVKYSNVTITGDLLLTDLDNLEPEMSSSRSYRDSDRDFGSRWFGRVRTRTYWSHVKASISFKDCVFEGSVLAYLRDDYENTVYNVVFHDDVSFEGCEFKNESAFKYVKFLKKANFTGASFSEEALFKYTDFSSGADFAKAEFKDDATFKYASIPGDAYFQDTKFRREATFKYTQFPKLANFKNAVFRRTANFKYAEFSKRVNFDNADFQDDADFKYTTVDGRSFTAYLLTRK